MRSLVLTHEKEGLGRILVSLKKIQSQVGSDFHRIALDAPSPLGGTVVGIVVATLPGVDHPFVESGGIAFEVPFAINRGGVARALQEFREGDLAAIEHDAVAKEAIDMAVFSGQDAGPARAADGIGAEIIPEKSPLAGDPVDIRRLVDFRAISANGLVGVIVGEKKNDIRPPGGCLSRSGPGGQRQRAGSQRRAYHE